jgi:hypothetical protein
MMALTALKWLTAVVLPRNNPQRQTQLLLAAQHGDTAMRL